MTPNEKAKILSEALPYIKKFTKKIMVGLLEKKVNAGQNHQTDYHLQ